MEQRVQVRDHGVFSGEERVILLAVALRDDDDNWLSVGLGGTWPGN